MSEIHEFQPDWMSPPGETIRELMDSRECSVEWLAAALEITEANLVDLLGGRGVIEESLAKKLAQVLGASKYFWMRLDSIYQDALSQSRKLENDWIMQVPFNDMVKHGWIETPEDKVKTILEFFNLPNATAWKQNYEPIRQNYAFKTSLSLESNPIGVSVWLRQGEHVAAQIQCAAWNPQTFHQSLADIRILTKQKNPQIFIPAMQAICAKHGVALVVIPSVKGCRASGAARLIASDKAIIVVSARYLSDDHFWFTFFHEAAHLVLHGGKLVLDFENAPGDAENPQHEVEANNFAANILIPEEYADDLRKLRGEHNNVIRFASKIGVCPGIVVGQLQHKGMLKRTWLNKLKRRYMWNRSDLLLKP
jgi:HTH-type transcriptional regulator / antitoxin HigA